MTHIYTSQLESLRLYGNKFTGNIPQDIGKLDQLRALWLHNNMFSGSVPSTITRLTKLSSLTLGGTYLQGDDFPKNIFQMPQLRLLDIRSVHISAAVKEKDIYNTQHPEKCYPQIKARRKVLGNINSFLC